MTLKLLIATITLLLTYQLAVASAVWLGLPSKCISCDWISPEETKALFQLNAQMEASMRAGDVFNFGDPQKDNHLMDVMEDIVTLVNTQRCNDTEAAKLVSMLARLEEGEEWWEKNRGEYVKKGLIGTLEKQFVKILYICLHEGRKMGASPEIRADLLEFLNFGEVLKSSFQFGSPGANVPKKSLKLIAPDDPELTATGNKLNQATKIMASDESFSRIKDIWGHHFKADVADGRQLCRLRLDENLIQKYGPLASNLMAIFKPILTLTSYNPENFVKIPKEEIKARRIFGVLEQAGYVLKETRVSELRQLHNLLKVTLRRAEDYCPNHHRGSPLMDY